MVSQPNLNIVGRTHCNENLNEKSESTHALIICNLVGNKISTSFSRRISSNWTIVAFIANLKIKHKGLSFSYL